MAAYSNDNLPGVGKEWNLGRQQAIRSIFAI